MSERVNPQLVDTQTGRVVSVRLAVAFAVFGMMIGASMAMLSMRLLVFGDQRAEMSYNEAVIRDAPVAFWPLIGDRGGGETDLTGGLRGTYANSPGSGTMPNGDSVAVFNGEDEYFEVPDSSRLSPTSTGIITIEAWIRPDTLEFDYSNGGEFVHWMGKGEPGAYEYATRMYNRVNDADRPNRISGYAFNKEGGLGAGSHFQDPIEPGRWIHYAFIINTAATSEEFPDGYTKIYRDGALRDVDNLAIGEEVVEPSRTDAPLRVGSRDLESFFEGAIGKVAVYGYEVDQETLRDHFSLMVYGRPVADGAAEGVGGPRSNSREAIVASNARFAPRFAARCRWS